MGTPSVLHDESNRREKHNLYIISEFLCNAFGQRSHWEIFSVLGSLSPPSPGLPATSEALPSAAEGSHPPLRYKVTIVPYEIAA